MHIADATASFVENRPTSRRDLAQAGRVPVVMGWARWVLALATGVVLVLIVARVAFGRSLLDALRPTRHPEPFPSEVVGVAAQFLPAALVAWCLGFAVAAMCVRATWLGPRAAGILAGACGVAAGTALLVLSP